MIDLRLSRQLAPVANRFRRLCLWRNLAVAWLLAAALGLGLLALGERTGLPLKQSMILVGVAAFAAATVAAWRSLAAGRDLHWVAEQVEAEFPALKSCLLTAVEQRPELPDGRYGFLQERVIRQAIGHGDRHVWQQAISTRRLNGARLANFAAFCLLCAVLAGLALRDRARESAVARSPGEKNVIASEAISFTVEPGNAEIERGTSLLVLARFQGPQPAEASLIYQPPGGESSRVTLAKSLADPVFGGRIPTVDAPLEYRVELGARSSETYHVEVFEYPKLVRADAKIVYPEYTALEERLIQDVRTISVVEGAELTVLCYLNKAVASATLAEKEGETVSLTAAEGDAPLYQTTIRCEKSGRYQVQLTDDRGRRNQTPSEIVINVLPNRPPDLKLAFPARDIEVSPLEESDVKATAWDDYGLKRTGLTYALAGAKPEDIVLGENAAARQRHELAHVIRFEELKAEPDELLSYYFWAEDFGPDGKVRRTQSDMYFAEVRHFEEIFRQGEQPPGGESQQQQQQAGENAQQAEKLAELQKEIINATWKLIRRETAEKPSAAFADDAKLIHQSQGSALEQATALAGKLQDIQSKRHAAAVSVAMLKALEQLEQAKDGPALEALQPALSAEQAAYQALLKLRAREHRVIRSQQQRGGGSSGGAANRSQQQLQQLELSNDENRYETQRTAQSQQQQQDREARQTLNRLSELARRQKDLNERLKELQSALDEAKTEQEREEIRRQLKRLRDEQQEILRDADELKARMESPENQSSMAEARDQLDQTREQLRKASEALEQEQVSQAAAAGTRAEQDFQTLRNEFRRRIAGQFDEQMRELRDEARQLDEREQQLSERLASPDEPSPEGKSLRGQSEEDKLPEQLAEQKQRLENLVERMRETIEEAEQSEPLLSERLYDAARKVQQQNLPRALEAAELSMRRGLQDDAREQERLARSGIRELREGVERAAESVLGDDAEALRRARDELERLARDLNDEIARNMNPDGEQHEQTSRGGQPSAEDENGAGPGERNSQAGRNESEKGEQNPNGRRAQGDAQQQERETPGQGGEPGKAGRQRPMPGQRPSAESERTGGEQEPMKDDGAQGPIPQQGRGGEGESQQPMGSKPMNPEGSQQGEGGGQQGDSESERSGRPSGGIASNEPQSDSQQSGQAGNQRGGARETGGPGGPGGFDAFRQAAEQMRAPIAGEDFRDWSDRLRDVEEMVDDPELRAEAARIRQRARDVRRELKRHSVEPNWELIRVEVSEPLVELRDRVAEELLRRTNKDALIPLDRDPAPPRYSEQTRRYYERLGSGE
jgi:hypothetical protein